MKNLVCFLFILTYPTIAHEFKSPQSQHIADQLVRSINQKLAEIAALEISAGANPEDIRIDLSQVERYDSGRFGAILDARTQGKIISITPKSQAYKLGLQSGDTIIEVNGSPVLLSDTSWHKQLQYEDENSSITLKIRRNEQELILGGALKAKYTPQWQLNSSKDLLLVGTLKAKYIPQWSLSSSSLLPINHSRSINLNQPTSDLASSCGRIIIGRYLSEFTRHSGTAAVTNIDGKYVNTEILSHKLTIGEHTLKVHRRYAKKNKDIISLTIEPNTTYYIGYVDDAEWESGAINDLYSGPSIIKTKHQACNLNNYVARSQVKSEATGLVCKQVEKTGSRIKRTICRSQEEVDKENRMLWRDIEALNEEEENSQKERS